MNSFHYFVRAATDWLFWRREPGLGLIRAGTLLLIAAISTGLIALVDFQTKTGKFKVSIDTSAGLPFALTIIAFAIGVLLIAAGLYFLFSHRKELARARVLVLELRGLRDAPGEPLEKAVPERLQGRREARVIDVRQQGDGTIFSPTAALTRLTNIQATIDEVMAGKNRDDMTIVAGSLAPVPFTFLLGVMLDDEGQVEIMDWDRTACRWRPLDDDDDGARFALSGIDALNGASECVLTVSVSYAANSAAILKTFGGLPVVNLTMPTLSVDGHWSSAKQDALAKQFFDTARQIEAKGVRQIHCVLVAPASIALRLGQAYDKRNLPPITVYQYEQDPSPNYPWGVRMPVAGQAQAEVFPAR